MRNRVLIMLKFGFVINKEREGNKVLLAKHIGEAYYDFITTLVNLHVLLVWFFSSKKENSDAS